MALLSLLCSLSVGPQAFGQQLPSGYIDTEVLSDLSEPATLAFAPDDRLFVGERISGRLLVAKRSGDTWALEPAPFFTFDIPKNQDGSPARHRSSGLRDIAFDPNFDTEPWVAAFYMQDNARHNRVARIRASTNDPDVGDSSTLEVLIDLPFNAIGSSLVVAGQLRRSPRRSCEESDSVPLRCRSVRQDPRLRFPSSLWAGA